MEVDKRVMINVVKTLVNDCERFANSLQRYNDLKTSLTNEEWDDLIRTFTHAEVELSNELNDRYENHLSRIMKLK